MKLKPFFAEHPFRTGGIVWLTASLMGVILGAVAAWIESKVVPCLLKEEDCIDFSGLWLVALAFWGLVGGFLFGMVVAIVLAVKNTKP